MRLGGRLAVSSSNGSHDDSEQPILSRIRKTLEMFQKRAGRFDSKVSYLVRIWAWSGHVKRKTYCVMTAISPNFYVLRVTFYAFC